MKKKVLVIGGGGREHAICWAVSRDRADIEVYCAPGNGGIAQIARCVEIAPTDVRGLAQFAVDNQIDLTIVGGESSLAAGVVDEFEKRELRIVGPNLAASRLESSKIFAKDFMTRHKIPTARYRAADSVAEALSILQSGEFGDAHAPVVIKADGLAAGKGVVVAKNRAEAIVAIEQMMTGNGMANRILLEETLTGREVSLLIFADGKNFLVMPPARDHKRIGEGDTGPNTGGMGTITDRELLSDEDLQKIIAEMIEPTLVGAAAEGFPFRGILFLGLMMTADGAKLLEYNVRFGDPEAQSILVRLKSDLTDICEAIVDGTLGNTRVEFRAESSACIILAVRGYPSKPEAGDVISGLERARKIENVVVFHSGTKRIEHDELITAGGRVMGVTASGKSLTSALATAYQAVQEISWDGMLYRRDIGK